MCSFSARHAYFLSYIWILILLDDHVTFLTLPCPCCLPLPVAPTQTLPPYPCCSPLPCIASYYLVSRLIWLVGFPFGFYLALYLRTLPAYLYFDYYAVIYCGLQFPFPFTYVYLTFAYRTDS